jgi:hypothetical protein
MKEMSVLARNSCYTLPYCQGTDPCGEVKILCEILSYCQSLLWWVQTGVVEYFRK